MRLKFLLLFLLVVGCCALSKAQTTKPYKNLLITEALSSWSPSNYVEITNMGTETVDLSQFELGNIAEWSKPWETSATHFMLPKKMLDPGKSFVMSTAFDFEPENWVTDPLHNRERVTRPEMYKIADKMMHFPEERSTEKDSITPGYQVLDGYDGGRCFFLRHFYTNAEGKKDSAVIDVFNGVFDDATGTNNVLGYDVAGVVKATANNTLVRKSSVKTGNVDFNGGRGLDYADSEWIPIPKTWGGWEPVFWTVGNQVDITLDANTLVSKTEKVKVDLEAATITEPWGLRRGDSIMYQFNRKPGLAWRYSLSEVFEDSAFVSARTGDVLSLIVCGNEAITKDFTIIVEAPTASDNIVIPKNSFDYTRKIYKGMGVYSGFRISDGVKGMDTISYVDFATRVDTLFKYLEKAPKASWKIVFKDGVEKPDLIYGDILRVTSEDGKIKDYFLKLEKFVSSQNAFLSSITWPDIPAFFKGDIAGSYGWSGDTIPGFTPSRNDYVVRIPYEYQGIPALAFSKQQTDSKVVVKRASTLDGTPEDRTVTFTVTAEAGTPVMVYTVRFEKEKNPENVQPYKGEPFFSQYIFFEQWANYYLEIANPGTDLLDLSNYMIVGGWGAPQNVFTLGTGVNNWNDAYYRYVPGKKWQNQADWLVQPCILEPDLSTNSIVYPGDVFVIADIRSTNFNDKNHGNGDAEYRKEIDIDFNKNSWGRKVAANNAISHWRNGSMYMFKILNDSVKNGLKPATDIRDFELIESFGSGANTTDQRIGGVIENMIQSNFRKPDVYKPNPVINGSAGTTPENSEWYFTDQNYYVKLKYTWPDQILRVCDGIGSHNMNEVTISKSSVSSKVYKVSPGYTQKETIKGLTSGTTVTAFYSSIVKANALQTLKIKSVATGSVLADDAVINKGDTLVVLSADSINTSKYILDVTANGLSANALLTSTKYTVNVTGTTGTIAGIKQRELLKNVISAVVVPAGATLTITDDNDAYMSLMKLNYDTTYVNVIATDKIYLEVIAENGITKIVYQLKPTDNTSDAYVTSDVYSVDQFASLIQFIANGTSVASLLNNVSPSSGATVAIFDKAGNTRQKGDVYRDDKLIVTSADGKVTKAYYFSMLNFNVNKYMAYVISDDYVIDQVNLVIKVPATGIDIPAFFAKLYPSFGANLSVIDKNGAATTLTKLASYDKLLVTAADNSTTATYKIEFATSVSPIGSAIKMYPNPTTDRVVINGLTVGNRVRVFNAVGVTLRDVIVDNATEYVNLSAQPAGIYVFVISNGEQHINIQKIIKR